MRGRVVLLITMVLMLGSLPRFAGAAEFNADVPARIAPDTQIIVNIPERKMRLFHNEALVFEFPVAVGQPIFQTPVGPRLMKNITWNPWWMPPNSKWAENDHPTPPGPSNPLGPVKMNLDRAILMHGTSKESSVGTPASHGCMRMYNENAKTLAWWAQTHFSDQTELELFDKYASNRRTTYNVNLQTFIPVEIVYELFSIEDGLFKVYPDIYNKAPNKQRAAINWFEELGVASEDINEEGLERLMRESGKIERFVDLRKVLSRRAAVMLEKRFAEGFFKTLYAVRDAEKVVDSSLALR